MTDKKQPKRRPISAARLYMAINEAYERLILGTDRTETTVEALLDALKDEIVKEATR